MQKPVRGFQVIEAYRDQGINLPQRSTFHAAGYDIEAAETITLPSYWKAVVAQVLESLGLVQAEPAEADVLGSTLVPTGLKVYMQADEYLQIVNRSSNPIKRRLMLPNGVGVIDADYYNNPNNEGHLYVQLVNYGLRDYTIHKGDRIAQGIFHRFLLADGDTGGRKQRQGGFGSSDEEARHGQG